MRLKKAGILAFFLILLFSSPTYFTVEMRSEEYIKNIEKLFSTYYPADINQYYLSLEKETPLYRMLLGRLTGKEKVFFLQMRPFLSEIAKASQKTGIPLSTIASLAKRESQFDPQAVSRKGAYGLMGVTFWACQDVLRLRKRYRWIDEALEEYGKVSWDEVKNNPELNIVVGAIYYRFLLEEFEDPFLASLAYNWGMGNVYLMLEKYEDKKAILSRLRQMASLNKAWAEPADYPEYISIFKKTFQKVEEKIRLVYVGYKEISPISLNFLSYRGKVPSS